MGRDTIRRMYEEKPIAPVRVNKSWPIREIALCILLFLAGGTVGYALRGTQPAAPALSVDAALDASAKDDPAQGPENAPVTIVEFADYECGYCRMWYQEVFSQLMAKYGDKIRFVFRDFPLDFHPNSQPAAEAANCAGEQERYWEYQDQLWGTGEGLDSASLRQYAQGGGLDLNAFDACVRDNRYADEIRQDMLDGMRNGVNGTPAFLVNGRLIPGALPYDDFAAIIEQELNQ
jgi:protein-disulfide isomerase